MELIVSKIEKSFGEKQVLKGASYTFRQGGIYGLLGRNGAGKTTPVQLPVRGIPRRQGHRISHLRRDCKRPGILALSPFF